MTAVSSPVHIERMIIIDRNSTPINSKLKDNTNTTALKKNHFRQKSHMHIHFYSTCPHTLVQNAVSTDRQIDINNEKFHSWNAAGQSN